MRMLSGMIWLGEPMMLKRSVEWLAAFVRLQGGLVRMPKELGAGGKP